MAPSPTAQCPRCHQQGNPANFGATCDPCRTELHTHQVIDLRDDPTHQAELAAARREQYAR